MTNLGRACLALSLLSLMGSKVLYGGPPVKLGRDPGGTPIAILADGFDYRPPDVAAVLARDGEGEAIALDLVDTDHRPFEGNGAGTRFTRAATELGDVRVVMLRVDWEQSISVARAITFATKTPARIALMPLTREARRLLKSLTRTFSPLGNILFVASVPEFTTEERVASEGIANLVLLDSKDDELIAAKAIARALGCGQAPLAGSNGAELKTAFLARLQAQPPPSCKPESARKPN